MDISAESLALHYELKGKLEVVSRYPIQTQKDLSLALKATNDEVKNKIYKNMSKRAGDMLKEELEFMGPVKIRDVEDAQQKIVGVIRNLEDKGDIVVSRGKGDEMIV